MGASNTLIIKCDYVKDGRPCGKTFLLPDDPKLNSPGVEHTVCMTLADGRKLWFCSMLHAVAFGVEHIKGTPQVPEPPPLPDNVIPFSGKLAASLSLADLEKAGVIEREENLNLDETL